nr:MAG TPA: hypothetical protein [Siphoviridae sp. ctX8T1]
MNSTAKSVPRQSLNLSAAVMLPNVPLLSLPITSMI